MGGTAGGFPVLPMEGFGPLPFATTPFRPSRTVVVAADDGGTPAFISF